MLLGVVTGTVIVISSISWPMAWLGLELNLIRFVPAVIKEERIKKTSMFYFITQRLGSLLILTAGLFLDLNNFLILILLMGIILKMGAIPFHFWVPMVVPFLDKFGVYAIQSWQKIAPISLLVFCVLNKRFLTILNIWLGAFLIMRIRLPIMVIIFSGIVQVGWIFALNPFLIWWFLRIYFIVLLPTIMFIKTNSRNFSLSLVNRGGLPPFTGFIIKLSAIKSLRSFIASSILMGRGIALVTYSRMLLNKGFKKDELSPAVIVALIAGLV